MSKCALLCSACGNTARTMDSNTKANYCQCLSYIDHNDKVHILFHRHYHHLIFCLCISLEVSGPQFEILMNMRKLMLLEAAVMTPLLLEVDVTGGGVDDNPVVLQAGREEGKTSPIFSG